MTDVAITGIGVLSAFGHGIAPFWEGLLAGRSGLKASARFPLPEGIGVAAEVPGVEPRRWARTPLGRRIDRSSLLALGACRLALVDAGDAGDLLVGTPAERIGLGLGSAFGNLGETSGFLDRLFARGTANPLVFPNLVMNSSLSYASIELGVSGPTAVLTEQEASGEAAIAWGARLIADGAADVCLAGGADELDPVLCEVLRDAGLATRDRPRPFDPSADGAAPGEGAAVLVLEPLARARARGARVYARVQPHPGFSVPSPVHGWPRDAEPVGDGLAALLADADLVVAAASGQPALDRVEAAALARALGGRAVPVTAPRGAIGAFGAAGALGAAAAALAVHAGAIPPTAGATGVRVALDLVRGAARTQAVRVAVVDGLARGGACRPLRLEAA